MKKLVVIWTIFASVILISCSEQNFKTIQQNGISIKVPIKMTSVPRGEILDSAILEMADTEHNLFLAIEKIPIRRHSFNLDSIRINFVDFYLIEDTIGTYKITKTSNPKGYIVETTTIMLNYNNADLTYWIVGAFIDKKHQFAYIVWTWCDQIYKEQNKTIMKKIVKSFKINAK